jgi:hypothetical protein
MILLEIPTRAAFLNHFSENIHTHPNPFNRMELKPVETAGKFR